MIRRSNTRDLVYAGAEFLDHAFGTKKWRKMVDPEKLALNDGESCILGQIYGHFDDGIDKLGISFITAKEFGFDISEGVTYNILDKVWKEVLKQE